MKKSYRILNNELAVGNKCRIDFDSTITLKEIETIHNVKLVEFTSGHIDGDTTTVYVEVLPPNNTKVNQVISQIKKYQNELLDYSSDEWYLINFKLPTLKINLKEVISLEKNGLFGDYEEYQYQLSQIDIDNINDVIECQQHHDKEVILYFQCYLAELFSMGKINQLIKIINLCYKIKK